MHRLLVSCPDGPGIVAAVSSLLAESGANIVSSDQFSTDPEGGRFFLRIVFHLDGDATALEARFCEEVAAPFGMNFRIHDAAVPKRVAIMVSRYDHVLLDLLWRSRRGELPMDVGVVVSNWATCARRSSASGSPTTRSR